MMWGGQDRYPLQKSKDKRNHAHTKKEEEEYNLKKKGRERKEKKESTYIYIYFLYDAAESTDSLRRREKIRFLSLGDSVVGSCRLSPSSFFSYTVGSFSPASA